MKKLLLFVLPLCMVGCDGRSPNSPESLSETTKSFENPVKVGNLPDGREVKVIVRDMGSQPSHFIYFVGETTTVNSYYTTSDGETTTKHPTASVTIDGVKYVPVEKTK